MYLRDAPLRPLHLSSSPLSSATTFSPLHRLTIGAAPHRRQVTGGNADIRLVTALLKAAGRNQGGTNRVRVPSDLTVPVQRPPSALRGGGPITMFGGYPDPDQPSRIGRRRDVVADQAHAFDGRGTSPRGKLGLP